LHQKQKHIQLFVREDSLSIKIMSIYCTYCTGSTHIVVRKTKWNNFNNRKQKWNW